MSDEVNNPPRNKQQVNVYLYCLFGCCLTVANRFVSAHNVSGIFKLFNHIWVFGWLNTPGAIKYMSSLPETDY